MAVTSITARWQLQRLLLAKTAPARKRPAMGFQAPRSMEQELSWLGTS